MARGLRLGTADELIVADNSGTVPADAAPARVVRAERGTVASARPQRRRPPPQTREWILFLDADTIAPADLLDRYFDRVAGPSAGILAGEIHPADGAGRSLATRYATQRNFLSARAHVSHPFRPRAAAANLMVRRAAQPAPHRQRPLSALAAQREPRPGCHRRRHQRQHRRGDAGRLRRRDHRHPGRGGARGDPCRLSRRGRCRHRDLRAGRPDPPHPAWRRRHRLPAGVRLDRRVGHPAGLRRLSDRPLRQRVRAGGRSIRCCGLSTGARRAIRGGDCVSMRTTGKGKD